MNVQSANFSDRWDVARVADISGLSDEWVSDFMNFCKRKHSSHVPFEEFIASMSQEQFENYIRTCVNKY
jgi:hypothetical protein